MVVDALVVDTLVVDTLVVNRMGVLSALIHCAMVDMMITTPKCLCFHDFYIKVWLMIFFSCHHPLSPDQDESQE